MQNECQRKTNRQRGVRTDRGKRMPAHTSPEGRELCDLAADLHGRPEHDEIESSLRRLDDLRRETADPSLGGG